RPGRQPHHDHRPAQRLPGGAHPLAQRPRPHLGQEHAAAAGPVPAAAPAARTAVEEEVVSQALGAYGQPLLGQRPVVVVAGWASVVVVGFGVAGGAVGGGAGFTVVVGLGLAVVLVVLLVLLVVESVTGGASVAAGWGAAVDDVVV